MRILSVALSIAYSMIQIASGLLLHPYQTMQSLVKDRVFVWMTLLPSALLMILTLAWHWVMIPLAKLVFSCQQTWFVGCDLWPLFANWVTFFCLYWQLLLIYLLFRFSWIFRTN